MSVNMSPLGFQRAGTEGGNTDELRGGMVVMGGACWVAVSRATKHFAKVTPSRSAGSTTRVAVSGREGLTPMVGASPFEVVADESRRRRARPQRPRPSEPLQVLLRSSVLEGRVPRRGCRCPVYRQRGDQGPPSRPRGPSRRQNISVGSIFFKRRHVGHGGSKVNRRYAKGDSRAYKHGGWTRSCGKRKLIMREHTGMREFVERKMGRREIMRNFALVGHVSNRR